MGLLRIAPEHYPALPAACSLLVCRKRREPPRSAPPTAALKILQEACGLD